MPSADSAGGVLFPFPGRKEHRLLFAGLFHEKEDRQHKFFLIDTVFLAPVFDDFDGLADFVIVQGQLAGGIPLEPVLSAQRLTAECKSVLRHICAEGGGFSLNTQLQDTQFEPLRESVFKAFGRALAQAFAIDETAGGRIPSTKGVL